MPWTNITNLQNIFIQMWYYKHIDETLIVNCLLLIDCIDNTHVFKLWWFHQNELSFITFFTSSSHSGFFFFFFIVVSQKLHHFQMCQKFSKLGTVARNMSFSPYVFDFVVEKAVSLLHTLVLIFQLRSHYNSASSGSIVKMHAHYEQIFIKLVNHMIYNG